MPAGDEIVTRSRAAQQAMLDYFLGLIPERRRTDRLSEGELLITRILSA
jgi:hypothetical protein